MASSTEHSKTDENRDAVGGSPPEAVASQTDSDAELAKLRIVGDGRSRIWTTCERDMPANWTANEQRNGPGWPARWLPVVDNLERAIAHTGDQSDAVVEGVGAFSNKRYRFSSSSAIRAMRRRGAL